ncbi:flagellin [Rhodobacter capsulatus]|uniref:Flagellin n=1 Tax=Rhodobacter capsulatus TaxID=1061 RepID=A0A1G7EAC2_RHOCA|nr:flagellin [Rhodobacter capsulatus]WER09392.1 flagellin [Rhodobacter capsulatus]SDE60587.1 flagellin [Rhodobacter capsulatus]
MSSINTNTSAMVALQTLKGINSNLAKTQSEISTGKSVASAKDNSAIWAISKVMESDVAGFESVSTNLATGQSMVSVARTATESITDDLKSIKQKVVAAQDPSADKEKLANEVKELVSMIQSKVSGAQFNGVNLINNTDTQKVVGSLDRVAGVVTANTIDVAGVNLGSKAGGGAAEITAGTGLTASADKKAAGGTVDDAGTIDFTLASAAKDDVVNLRLGDTEFSYTVSAADDDGTTKVDDVVVTNLLNQINNSGISGLTATYDGTAGKLIINNGTGSNLNVTLSVAGKGDGELAALSKFTGAAALADPTALADIEAMIKTTVDAAASFGAVESRLESQASFVDDLSAAMKSGIGSLVDADMEEASARLQALQTQQQLGIQALSIANQQPQSILSLFK